MIQWVKSGKPWIWLSGGAVSISLIAVLGLLLLIGWKGLTYFWPMPVYQWEDASGNRIIGQVYQKDSVPVEHVIHAKQRLPEEVYQSGSVERLNIKVANRELYPLDFISVLSSDLKLTGAPENIVVLERARHGSFFGTPVAYIAKNITQTEDVKGLLEEGIESAAASREEIVRISENEIKPVGWELSQLKLERRKAELNNSLTEAYLTDYNKRKNELSARLSEAELKLVLLQKRLDQEKLVVQDMTGAQTEVSLGSILNAWYPNNMSYLEKVQHWLIQVKQFLLEQPREANSEGGIFPAIFGTVFLVLLMSVIVMPLGVMAAIYLHEYAKEGPLTRLIRIAVMNLAGVPSIVYGVFGLGFFVYTIGGSLDDLLYADKLPTPTFGTPGVLWSALTLALLTLPVVIVATEEGLSRIPNSVRHGSLALGATQFETIWRIVLPMASPAIITGLILAVARAAGEVAPLMLVGVVKLAPTLPVDTTFPYVHLERKFMHMGYHIYDLGFQSPNIEAARPLVYATSFLLVTVIVGLNLTAINIRNNLREKFRTLGQD
ncbi:phosphate ABC transporter permease PstA [Vibrio sp. JC009]|uniref:phosphate ABC transporter permease PstA n=1 Tax=Vibrio sp. JC009 TaxID=2912314 RepID=UPI0023B0E762|nr:phosphate ABC transporter permease PstA [Vibrio sp. JC009]WED22323.1 phosphate ABC transporter permease PstA [Vibrio sp. JC009]